MGWVVVAVAAVLVVVIGLVAVGVVTAQLATRPATSVYDIVEATEYIATRLPDRVAARLSTDDVESILFWHLGYLRSGGLATFGGVDDVAELAARRAELRRADRIAREDDAIDHVVAEARRSEREIDEVDVVVVLDLEAAYLASIGAVGPPATDGDGEVGRGENFPN